MPSPLTKTRCRLAARMSRGGILTPWAQLHTGQRPKQVSKHDRSQDLCRNCDKSNRQAPHKHHAGRRDQRLGRPPGGQPRKLVVVVHLQRELVPAKLVEGRPSRTAAGRRRGSAASPETTRLSDGKVRPGPSQRSPTPAPVLEMAGSGTSPILSSH